MRILELFTVATILIGFLGILFKENLMMKIISMDVMSTGVVAFYVFVAARKGLIAPIVSDHQLNLEYADPVPQAVILTAIVIGLSIQALMLVGAMKLARENPTLEISEIEKDIWYRARIRNHGHSCFLCEIVIRSQFHTTYEPEA
jgi:Multisubunit Na+/H+ antiporter, MnhC subunit